LFYVNQTHYQSHTHCTSSHHLLACYHPNIVYIIHIDKQLLLYNKRIWIKQPPC